MINFKVFEVNILIHLKNSCIKGTLEVTLWWKWRMVYRMGCCAVCMGYFPRTGNALSCRVIAPLKCFLATRLSYGTKAAKVLRQFFGTISLQVAPLTHDFKDSDGGNSPHYKNTTSSSQCRIITEIWGVGKYENKREKRHSDRLTSGKQTISHQEIISNI